MIRFYLFADLKVNITVLNFIGMVHVVQVMLLLLMMVMRRVIVGVVMAVARIVVTEL